MSQLTIQWRQGGEYMVKKMSQFLAICTIGVISWFLVQNPMIDQYIVKQNERPAVSVSKPTDNLKKQIEAAAVKYRVNAVDAVVDRVWKKTPGYNGLQVDVEKSLKRMKNKGRFQENKLVLKQVSPNIHLKDLPPAPIYRANPNKPVVAFIVNVAWGNEYIPSMLAVLKKHNLHVSFVLEGRWVKNNPEVAKQIANAGHELGNHSYSHPNMQQLSLQAAKKEISETNKIIKETTGKEAAFFGPPSGSFNDSTVNAASSFGMETVLWTVDTVDWRKPSPEVLTKRVLDNVHKGAIVLMHPTESTSKSLETLIMNIEKEYKIVTVSEAFSEKRITR